MTFGTGRNDPDIEAIGRLLDENIERIRTLNDRLRTEHRGGSFVVTPGITALGAVRFKAIIRAVSEFDKFTPENDPYGHHDCAVMTVDGIRIIWKIDCCDSTRQYLSPDAADPRLTRRMLTIMRADEY